MSHTSRLETVQMSAAPTAEPVVIVGTGHHATVAYECFSRDSSYEVVAFSVEERYVTGDTYNGLPLVPLENIASMYSAGSYLAFVAVSPSQGASTRRRLYSMVKSTGYSCASYVSSRAFAVRNVKVGENVFVQEYTALQHMARIGNNVFIGSGTCIGHSATVEDDCFISQHVVIAGFSRIGRGSFLGANSCVADLVTVAEECVLNPGSVVLKDTKFGQVYTGNPARPKTPEKRSWA